MLVLCSLLMFNPFLSNTNDVSYDISKYFWNNLIHLGSEFHNAIPLVLPFRSLLLGEIMKRIHNDNVNSTQWFLNSINDINHLCLNIYILSSKTFLLLQGERNMMCGYGVQKMKVSEWINWIIWINEMWMWREVGAGFWR